MPNLDALTQLPLAERLAAMESLWDSLCQDDAAELSPPWHAAVLDARLRELEDSQRKAEEERLKQNEEFKELYERTQSEKEQLAQQFETHKQAIQRKELEASSYKVATALTRDTARAELLAEKAASFAKHTDDGLVYEIGGVAVNADQLQKHLAEKYPFLVDGSGATGGGASGTQRPSGVSEVNHAAQTAKSKGDLTGFLTAQLNQQH